MFGLGGIVDAGLPWFNFGKRLRNVLLDTDGGQCRWPGMCPEWREVRQMAAPGWQLADRWGTWLPPPKADGGRFSPANCKSVKALGNNTESLGETLEVVVVVLKNLHKANEAEMEKF